MKRVVIVLVLALAVAGGWFGWRMYEKAEAAKPLEFYGNVDIREVNLGFRVSGRVLEVLKQEGDAVKAGEVIAKLDDAPYRTALEQANAEVAALEARLAELQNGSRKEEIAQAEAALVADDATLENARQLLDRQKQLVSSRAISQQDLDNAEAAYREAKARRDATQASLDLVNAGARTEQVAQASANLQSARAAAEVAKIQLEDAQIKAPEDGVVLVRVVEPGSIVQPGATVVSVSLVSPVWARAYVPEPQLGQVYPGRQVLVYTDSRKEPYQGQIGDVSPRAEFTPKAVETRELRTSLVYRFRVIVNQADTGLRQGMPITVKFSPVAPAPVAAHEYSNR